MLMSTLPLLSSFALSNSSSSSSMFCVLWRFLPMVAGEGEASPQNTEVSLGLGLFDGRDGAPGNHDDSGAALCVDMMEA